MTRDDAPGCGARGPSLARTGAPPVILANVAASILGTMAAARIRQWMHRRKAERCGCMN